MRKLSTSIVVTGLLLSSQSWAQGEEVPAEPVTLAEDDSAPAEAPAAEPPAAAPPAAAPPAAEATVAASPSEASVGAIVQMGDVSATPGGPTGGPPGGGQVGSVGGPTTASDDEWKFSYNGYFRAPMRVGIGKRKAAKSDQSETTLSVPQLPSDQYLDWQYTQSVERSWAESFFSYGNKYAKGVLGLQAFRFSDASFADPEAQFGFAQGYIEISPDLTDFDENLRMKAWVGNFWRRYGGAGRYDAGAYDAFVIGRTHVMGEAVRFEYDYSDMVFFFEEGFGVKQPNPLPFHNTKFTLLAHAHFGFNLDQFLDVGLHFMNAWTQEPDHECISREEEVAATANKQGGTPADLAVISQVAQFAEGPVGACKHEVVGTGAGANNWNDINTTTGLVRRADSPDGSVKVFGADVVVDAGIAGRIFGGLSYISATHAVTVAPALEVIHANGGGFFKSGLTHQYFVSRPNWEDGTVVNRGGNGSIITAAWQWDMSLSSMIGAETLGQTQLDLALFGMFNKVASDDDPSMDGVSKLKYGAELVYTPYSWMGAALRFDNVNPRLDIEEQNFMAIAPRLIFHTSFATHETIEVGYAHFSYNTEQCTDLANLKCVQAPGGNVGPDGFGTRPGANATKDRRGAPVDIESDRGPYPDTGWDAPHNGAFFVTASMWW